LLAKIATDVDVTKRVAETVLESLTDTILTALQNDEKIVLPGFGSFSVGNRAAREGRNPQTGEAIQIAAARTVKFKALIGLKNALNS